MSQQSTGRRRAIKGWLEQDVHTRWRRLYCYTQRPGVARKAKALSNRRERREGKREAAE